jgi:hypothetical protein
MFWDIAIVFGIGLSQLFVTIYAVWVSVTENKLKTAAIIAVVGALGIVLTVYAAIRSGVSQQRLEADIAELKTRSFIDIGPTEFGVERDPNGADYGKTFVNVSCANVGAQSAWLISCGGMIFVDARSPIDFGQDKDRQEQFFKTFVTEYKEQNPPQSLLPGVFRGFSAMGPVSTKPLIEDALNRGDKTIVIIGQVVYKDKNKDGDTTRKTDMCDWLQPPVTSRPSVWHACQVHSGEVTMQR